MPMLLKNSLKISAIPSEAKLTNGMSFHGPILPSPTRTIHQFQYSSAMPYFSNVFSARWLTVSKSKPLYSNNNKTSNAGLHDKIPEPGYLSGDQAIESHNVPEQNSIGILKSRRQVNKFSRGRYRTKPAFSKARSGVFKPKEKCFEQQSENIEESDGLIVPLYNADQQSDGVPRPQRRAAIAAVQSTDDLISTLDRLGKKLRTQDLNSVLRHFGKLEKWQELCLLFGWMQNQGKVSAAAYTSFITFLGKGLLAGKALKLYRDLKDDHIRSNVFVCNAMLNCLISNGRVETGMKLFEQMKEKGLNPDVVTYSTLLAGCVKTRHGYYKAVKFFEELKGKGLKLDSVMYGSLLAVCASHNLDEEAEVYFQQMKNEGYSANVFHYSSLINAYAAKGKYEKAEILVADMKSAGVVPNKVVLNSLLKVYARGGIFEKARKLLAELDASGLAVDEMPYCVLMDALAKAGKIEDAQKIFDEMKVKGIKSDGYSYSAMITAYSKNGQIDEAKKLAEELETTKSKYDLVMLNTLLKAYSRGNDMEGVMQTLKKMDELAISPNRHTFSILISYFCKEKLYDLARRTLEDMHVRGYHPTEDLCSSIISGLAERGSTGEAFNVYNQLKLHRQTLSKSLHEKILNILVAGKMLRDAYVIMKYNAKSISKSSLEKFIMAFAESGDVNKLNDVLKEFHNAGYNIEQGVFNIALSRYIEQGWKRDLFFQLVKWMYEQGYAINASTLSSLMRKLQDSGQPEIAEMLSYHSILSSRKAVPL